MVAKRGDPPYKHGWGPTMRPMVGGGARDARGPRAVWRTLAPTPWPPWPAFDRGSKALADWCILQKRMVQGERNEMCIDGHKVCQTFPVGHVLPERLDAVSTHSCRSGQSSVDLAGCFGSSSVPVSFLYSLTQTNGPLDPQVG